MGGCASVPTTEFKKEDAPVEPEEQTAAVPVVEVPVVETTVEENASLGTLPEEAEGEGEGEGEVEAEEKKETVEEAKEEEIVEGEEEKEINLPVSEPRPNEGMKLGLFGLW